MIGLYLRCTFSDLHSLQLSHNLLMGGFKRSHLSFVARFQLFAYFRSLLVHLIRIISVINFVERVRVARVEFLEGLQRCEGERKKERRSENECVKSDLTDALLHLCAQLLDLRKNMRYQIDPLRVRISKNVG